VVFSNYSQLNDSQPIDSQQMKLVAD